MPRRRHTPEQIIRKLREAEVELAKGQTAGEVVRCKGWPRGGLPDITQLCLNRLDFR